jgi:DNA-binding CsgD family transcriptional regulator
LAVLTPAERAILALLVRGASSKEIAARTKRSAQTVDTHIRSICRKLNCSGRREAVALAIGAGLAVTRDG